MNGEGGLHDDCRAGDAGVSTTNYTQSASKIGGKVGNWPHLDLLTKQTATYLYEYGWMVFKREREIGFGSYSQFPHPNHNLLPWINPTTSLSNSNTMNNTLTSPSLIKPLPTTTTIPSHFPTLPLHSRPFRYSLVSLNSPTFRFLQFKAAASDDLQATSANTSPKQADVDAQEAYEEYEVELEQPYGLKFAKGTDGGTYIDAIAPGYSADKTGKFSVGDKVLATSAVFGPEIWPAAEYGRTMYTMNQRIGPLYMKMQKRFGNLDYGPSQLSEKEIIRAERNSGFISNRVREIQLQNYQKKMEQKRGRERELGEGLQLYKAGKYEEARKKFESVLGSMPTPDEASVANYNVACCYSKLNQTQAGLAALEVALKQGYEDFKRIRSDPDLANLRTSANFETLLKRFDESFINENAVNAIKSLFGIFKKN